MAKLFALVVPLLYALVPTTGARAQAESGGATANLPKFAVAAIHPVPFRAYAPGQPPINHRVTFTPDGLLDEGAPLKRVIQVAFGISEDQVLRLPDWTLRNYYIAAKVDATDVPQFSKLTLREKWAMVLVLLEDRFGLKFHHEMKDMQTYALVIARGGPKLKKTNSSELGKDPLPPKVSGSGDGLHVEMNGATMKSVVDLVSRTLHSPVIDKTGLTDRYDFTLDFSPGVAELAATAQSGERAPNILTALPDQLGLKLESGKGAVDVIVIDDIKQPSPN